MSASGGRKSSVWALVPTESRETFAKVGGLPEPMGTLRWPACASCGGSMRFLFQLQHRPGALELDPYAALYAFQCENPRTACNRWSPSSGANAVIPVKLAKPSLVGGPASPRPYPEYRLTWAAALEASEALTVDVNRASAAELEALEKAREEAPDTKVGGVPVWLQSPSKMECHGQPMRFIAQVNAEPFSLDFGDDGRGYIFRCTHPEHGGFQFLVESA